MYHEKLLQEPGYLLSPLNSKEDVRPETGGETPIQKTADSESNSTRILRIDRKSPSASNIRGVFEQNRAQRPAHSPKILGLKPPGSRCRSSEELLATLAQFPASPWSGLVTQAARKSREVDAAMVRKLRDARRQERWVMDCRVSLMSSCHAFHLVMWQSVMLIIMCMTNCVIMSHSTSKHQSSSSSTAWLLDCLLSSLAWLLDCLPLFHCLTTWLSPSPPLLDCLTTWLLDCSDCIDYLTTWLLDCLTTWLLDYLTTWLLDCMIAWLDCLTAWQLDYLTVWLLDYLTAWLLDYLTAWLLDYLTTWLLDYLTVWLFDCLTAWLLDCLTAWLLDCPLSFILHLSFLGTSTKLTISWMPFPNVAGKVM